ncbi:sugar transferase [Actibacterium lipolyticum]|uniref:Putative sugar transferase EpsL n=1 Tax=Actibacterium lipolyticum TaxID=1524263 RepID=A0A238KWW8_9RHOB|nr:sugar transferase [Actibacterium lipolyticum]SMX47324.1 putative sugar transferase EpsL [Actibacterium lipolyticum]
MPRIIEICAVFCAAIVLLIPMAITAVLVGFSLGRPILFSQVRAGKTRKTFRIHKFRSMTEECDADGNLLPDADRQNGLTAILRRTRLDELPQLFAILRGDMALVGPRPLLPETIRDFGELGERRCAVRPGLTGWAQVSGNTNLTHEEKLKLDLWYAEHKSFALDMKILAETVGVVLFGERRNDRRLAESETWLAQSGIGGATI